MPNHRSDGICRSILDVVGQTPVVALERYCAGLDGMILVKLEYLNPGLSKKDRPALWMVRTARDNGSLNSGQTVVELTSGNTGTGLAIACGVLGHPFVAVMSAGNSVERARMMAALGAEVVIVPQVPGSLAGQVSGDDLAAVDERTRQIVTERSAFRADQFELQANPQSHDEGTGCELIEQAGNILSGFVDFVGSGGTFSGVARALKRFRPQIKCYALEPATAPYLAGQGVSDPRHRIQGGGYSRDLSLFDRSVCDGFLAITDDEAIATAREVARCEGIFGGFSTGANIAAAQRLLQGPLKGGVVACLACDSGLKYLSTDLWR